MAIDARTEIIVNRPREQVADYVTNPDNDPIWISGIVRRK